MSDGFVVDASISIGWVHPGQKSADSEDALSAIEAGTAVYAPGIWPLEVSNALLVLERRGKLSSSDRAEALKRLAKLPVTIDGEDARKAFSVLSKVASDYGLSVYDAAYLELSQRMKVALVCKDGPLRVAAGKAGLSIWSIAS